MLRGISKTYLLIFFVVCLLGLGKAQNQSDHQDQPTTHPTEVKALNSIFVQWKIKANSNQWNLSGEPCSGAAVDSTNFDDNSYNPFIKCNCSYNNHLLCHITHLKVYAMNVVGPIPEELWTLAFLSNLNLAKNFLTGPLSSSIGRLTRLQFLKIGWNALSGRIPKEMGQLTSLLSLSLGPNNFSGPLPSELGDLSVLQQLHIDSSGISGEIPPTFAQMKNLKILWASDINLTGKIPKFLGNWEKLKTLRLQGNNFEGPIPSTFVNLSSLKDLRISEVSNGGSSLAFIKDMKYLTILILRNNKISDSLPTDIGEYRYLKHLDFSFNNIQGQIPASLFNSSSLSFVFLGNNNLTGVLPQQKSKFLLNVDLSNNNLAGSLPPWVNQQNLQINLVGNNFVIENSTNSTLPPGLNCLQQNFPCNQGLGIYNSFRINCGGPQVTSLDGVVYEGDNETLGPATYFVSSTNRWAVSSIGTFIGSQNPKYILEFGRFGTARTAASSLRYYGLGLMNGNYTVTLLFAEAIFGNLPAVKRIGRRVFDVFLQGKLVSKDFEILNEEGGVYPPLIQRQFPAVVSENYLEIHFFWAGKGTCCVPREGTCGPSVSVISATLDFIPIASDKPPARDKHKTHVLVWIGVGVVGILLTGIFLFLVVRCIVLRKRRSRTIDGNKERGPIPFSYAQLEAGTNKFSESNKLGSGAFGAVYRGTLKSGRRTIAVKMLHRDNEREIQQFNNEVKVLFDLKHDNIVKILGTCTETSKHLIVLEYMEKGSLHRVLFRNNQMAELDWSRRYNICLDIAKGLAYLHEGLGSEVVMHRDIKPENILLDANFTAKITDFGSAIKSDGTITFMETNTFVGTPGYAAPEYVTSGRVSVYADVYSFGVVALQIVSGRQLVEEEKNILEWAREMHRRRRKASQLVDPSLSTSLSTRDEDQVKRVIGVALLCTQGSPYARPSMGRVVDMLTGVGEVNTAGISRLALPNNSGRRDATTGSVMTDTANTGSISTSYGGPSSSMMNAFAWLSCQNQDL